MNRPSVFISHMYSAEEEDWVRRFSEALEQRGVSVWSDFNQLHPGDDIREALEKGLRESDAIVAIVSPKNVGSPNQLFEIGAAYGMGKRIIPVVPEGLDPSEFPPSLRTRQFLIKRSPEETAEELAAATTNS